MKTKYITQVRSDGQSIKIPTKVVEMMGLQKGDYVKVSLKKVELTDE